MNISEITIDWSLYEGKDLIQILFKKQDELRELYKIRLTDLDLPEDQELLKWFAWCVTEEAAEAVDVLMTTDHREHLIDEAADMASFFFELLLVARYDVNDFPRLEWKNERDLDKVPIVFMNFITSLAITMNTLKNRDWRKTNLKTDRQIFYARMKETIEHFIKFVKVIGLTSYELYDGYFRKYAVNLFRIRSKY